MRHIEKPEITEFFNIWGREPSCCLCGNRPVQIHHNLLFKGRQSESPRTLLPVCIPCHEKANEKETRERLDLVMLSQFTDEDFQEFSRAVDYKKRLTYLRNKYEKSQ